MPGSATEAGEAAVRAAFAAQAGWCEAMGSPFTAKLCTLLGERLDRSTEVGRRTLDWPGNPDGWADGLPLRFCGGLHALVRRGAPLAHGYPPNPAPNDETLWAAIRRTLDDEAPALLAWLDHPPQTNEVGRAAALMSGLLVVAARWPLPIRLLELGASAGLNLIPDRYRYTLGGTAAGDMSSPLHLQPEWRGASPPAADLHIQSRRGVDLRPLDVRRDAERLLAFVWPDQRQRLAQLEIALAIAAADPPPVDAADAADWLDAELPTDPLPGATRVVMHSVAYQYFPESSQRRIAARIAEAGAAARADAPLAWLRFEKDPGDHGTTLRLAAYPGGGDRLLAHCQPHGRAIDWC